MASAPFVALAALLLAAQVAPALIYIPNVPVDPMNLYMLQVACNRLKANLDSSPSLPVSRAFSYYAGTFLTNFFLQKVVNDPGISNYNNVLYGTGNTVGGNKNLIFGSNNQVSGNSNYIFSQDFNSTAIAGENISNNLVLDDWIVQLLKIYMIPFWPRQAIRKWK